MKKIVQINVVCNGSTGRIMCDIAKKSSNEGFKTYCFYGRGNPNKDVNCIKIDNKLEVYWHVLITRLFNKHGHGSYFATKRMIKRLKNINPDIIHLHNIHGYYLNLKVLFNYLKNEYNGKVIWTLHDCWSFTGHCSHFTVVNCNKWKSSCHNCPQVKVYPKSLCFDSSKSEFEFKKKLFCGLPNLTIVSPSNWLAKLVKQSFLKSYEVIIINNGIDLNMFKPTYDETIYDKYNIPRNKKIILGVANIWEERKGLSIFIDIANNLSNDKQVVLVGLNQKQLNSLPSNIIGIKRTDDIVDLIKIYTLSSIFVNPSLEETFSLVTIEAIACNTPVIVCNTSAINELIKENVGIVVKKHICYEYLNAIELILKNESKYIKNLSAYISTYDIYFKINEYIEKYMEE